MEELTECPKCNIKKPNTEYRYSPTTGKRHGRVCKKCLNEAQMERHRANRDTRLAVQRRANQKLKHQAIEAYGGSCYCCGESELKFLTLDHVNRDGAQHRREISQNEGGRRKGGKANSGSYWYRQLRDEGYPNDPPLRVACFNCNFASYWWGVCPHQEQDNS